MRRELMLTVLRILLWSSPSGVEHGGARRRAPGH
jgi:hypothetical protein